MGAQHLRVPYGMIRALCYPGGQRLESRVSSAKPPEPGDMDYAVLKPYVHDSSTSRIVSPTAITLVGPANVPSKLSGNLINDAYRFFRGSMVETSHYFQCRGCEQDEHNLARKQYHMNNCRELMFEIEKILRRDKICVICNLGTQRHSWGIPLCSDACVVKWRFLIPLPYLAARRLVLASNPGLMKLKGED